MESPWVYILQFVPWQFICHLTFKSEFLPEHVRLSVFHAWVREVAGWHKIHFPRLLWGLRMERGEITQRRHFHALIAGLPEHAITETTCFAMKNEWENRGGGMARVMMFDPSLNGPGYIADSLGGGSIGGDVYESSKFGHRASELMLSESVQRFLLKRSKHWIIR